MPAPLLYGAAAGPVLSAVTPSAIGAFFAAHGGTIAPTLGQALLFGSRNKGPRRHVQIHQAQDTSLGSLQSPHLPAPVHWGRRRRQPCPIIYPPTVTRVDTTVRSVDKDGNARDQPAQDKHFHCAYAASLGRCNAPKGLWIDGEYVRFDNLEEAENGELRHALPYNGEFRACFLADGSQGQTLRDRTAVLARGGPASANRAWLDSDTVHGYAWWYVRFIAKAAGAERDPDTGELVQASLLPTIELDRWPVLELDFEARHVAIPSSADPSTWEVGYTPEFWAHLYDRLSLMGWAGAVNAQSFWDAHRIGAVRIMVDLPPADTNRGQRRWMLAASRPSTPVTFDPGAGWQSRQPTEDAPAGQRWWMIVRVGETAATFQYWTAPQVWVRPRASGPEGFQGNQGLAVVRSGVAGDMGPDIEIPPIGGPGEDEDVNINLPPAGEGEDDPLDGDDDYRNRFTEEERQTIRYPVSVGSDTSDLTEQGLADFLNRSALNHHGYLLHQGGELIASPGYASDPVADLHDGRDITITVFESSDRAAEQWNAYTASIEQAGEAAAEKTLIEIDDTALIGRQGRKSKLDLGVQPHFANRLNATMGLAKAAVRQRYQRHGVFETPPDTDLRWNAILRAGARVRLTSDRHDLESYRQQDGRITRQPHTTCRLLSVVRASDRSYVCTWREDPSIIWHDYLALPALDPDVSQTGVFVEDVRNLSLQTLRFETAEGVWQSWLRAEWDPTDVSTRIRYRLTVPSGTTLKETIGNSEVTRPGGYVGPWVVVDAAHSGFIEVGPVRVGASYEVSAQHYSPVVAGDRSDSATITIGGDTTAPDQPANVSSTGLYLAFLARYDRPTEKDFDVTEMRCRAGTSQAASPNGNTLTFTSARGDHMVAMLPGDATTGVAWLRHRDQTGNNSPWVRVSVTQLEEIEGADGRDGNGAPEYVFAAWSSLSLPASKRPSDSWGFDQPATSDGLRWHDGAVATSLEFPWLFRAERDVVGNPAVGDPVPALWAVPVPISHYGANGLPPPENVRATSANRVQSNLRQSILSVNWDAVTGAAAYRVVYQYQLGAGDNVKLSTGSVRVPGTSTTITVSDSASGSNRSVAYWTVTVHTIDSEGTVGGPSETVEVDGVVPSVVTRLDAPNPTVTVGNQRIDISNYSVTNGITYELQWRRVDAILWTTQSDTLTGGNTFLSGLTNGQGYRIRMRATNGNVNSAWWNSGTLTPVGTPVAPSAPTNLRETSKSDNTIQWDWSPPSSFGTGSGLIYRWILRRGRTQVGTGTTSARVHVARGLTANTAYTLLVRAETNAGNSSYTSDSATTDKEPVRPAAWQSWSGVNTVSLAVTSGLGRAIRGPGDSGAEREGSILRWDADTPGIWNGATDTGIFCAHAVTIGGASVIIQTFQSATSNGNRMRRTDTDTYFSTNLSYLNGFGTNITSYRATGGHFNNTGDFCVPITSDVSGLPSGFFSGAQPIGFARWNKDTIGDEGVLTIFALTTRGAVRIASRRYEVPT